MWKTALLGRESKRNPGEDKKNGDKYVLLSDHVSEGKSQLQGEKKQGEIAFNGALFHSREEVRVYLASGSAEVETVFQKGFLIDIKVRRKS